MSDKSIPEVTMYSMSERFLVCREDGRIEVKDGRTLEEYINDPRLVARRAVHGVVREMAVMDYERAQWGLLPRCA
jgi:hypothetical protein